MLILKVMLNAGLSRVNGGIVFDCHRKPILKSHMDKHINAVKANEGEARYYHLDDFNCVLKRFDRMKDGNYFLSKEESLTLSQSSQMALAYEIANGLDVQAIRFRVPFTEHEGLAI